MYIESCALHAAESLVEGSADIHIPWRSGVAIDPQHSRSTRQAVDDGLSSLLQAGADAAPAHAANAAAIRVAVRLMRPQPTAPTR
jgi:hypothetical protein